MFVISLEEAGHVEEPVGLRRRRQRCQEPPAVAHGAQPRIEDGEHAAIQTMTEQPAEPLLEREDRERHLVLAERSIRRAR